MAYNQSRIKMFRRCQRQYAYRYDTAGKLGLEPEKEMVRKVKSKGLEKGTWMHKLLEAHHRAWAGVPGKPWEKVHKKLKKKFKSLFEEEREHLGDLPTECENLFRGYLRFWGEDIDRYTVAKLKDGSPAIEFVVEVSLKKYGIKGKFKGQVDLLVEDNDWGGLWIWDHKNVKNIPGDDERMMSPQNCMYVWALRKMGYDVRGFVYNYLRTKPPTIPAVYVRSGKYGAAGTLRQTPSMDTDYYTYLQAIKDAHGDQWKNAAKLIYKGYLIHLKERQWMWYRRVPMPVEDEKIQEALAEFLVSIQDIIRRDTKHPPRSYFYSCRWNCEYHELCTAEFAGLDIEGFLKDYTFEDERYAEADPRFDLMKE
jgi:hypothetical protein